MRPANAKVRQRQGSAYHNRLVDQLHFYYHYFRDVVPQGVTVQHCPTGESGTRDEIQLLTPSGRIFMSGLVSIDRSTTEVESVAGSEAYTHWLDGDFVPGADKWRFFIAHTKLLFFICRHGNHYEKEDWADPMMDAENLAAYLQCQYDRLEYH